MADDLQYKIKQALDKWMGPTHGNATEARRASGPQTFTATRPDTTKYVTSGDNKPTSIPRVDKALKDAGAE